MTSASDRPPLEAIERVREASRRLVRELGFTRSTLAGTHLPPSAVHALIEIGRNGTLTAAALCDLLDLEKSSVSRMVRKLVDGGELKEGARARDGRSKALSLTRRGKKTLAAINAFAHEQVGAALTTLAPADQASVLAGLDTYARALATRRTGSRAPAGCQVTIESGYRPGLVGRCAEMHARYYARTVGFGSFFESRVAAGLADFVGRLDTPTNGIWSAIDRHQIVGTIAIDGEDLGPGVAHLRWFIMDDGQRGRGIGRRLLNQAVEFCDGQGFREIQLWTFKGLDAARWLYEAFGFTLVEEHLGRQWGAEVTEQRFVRVHHAAKPESRAGDEKGPPP